MNETRILLTEQSYELRPSRSSTAGIGQRIRIDPSPEIKGLFDRWFMPNSRIFHKDNDSQHMKMVTLGQVLACFFLEPVSRCPVSKFTRAMCDL